MDRNARVLISAFGSLGDLFPYLALGKRLTPFGHQVTLATSLEQKVLVEAAGFLFAELTPNLSANDSNMIRLVLDPKKGVQNIIRKIMLPALPQTYRELTALALCHDIMVSHPLSFASSLVHEKTGIPWISTQLTPMGYLSEYDLCDFGRYPGWRKLMRHAPGVARLLLRLGKRGMSFWGRPIQDIRKIEGLLLQDNPILDGMRSPQMDLALFSKLLGTPQRDWPAATLQTGFLFHDTLPDARDQAELDAFLKSSPDRPDVYTLGSGGVYKPGAFYDVAIKTTLGLRRRAVLLAGPLSIESPDPSRILVLKYFPHPELFAHARVLITSAGIGTLARGLQSGRPLILVPIANDQPDNALRMTRQGYARSIRPKDLTVENLSRSFLECDGRSAADTGKLIRQEILQESQMQESVLDRVDQFIQKNLRNPK
jgi:UDP:flavonoid glycosyltransferase YjiC (YdhE family)